MLFEEATGTYAALLLSEVATYVTIEDFQYFWQRERERTGSLYSGLHCGHYKAVLFCCDISALHSSKLSLVVQKGVLLSRWNRGLTVFIGEDSWQCIRPQAQGYLSPRG